MQREQVGSFSVAYVTLINGKSCCCHVGYKITRASAAVCYQWFVTSQTGITFQHSNQQQARDNLHVTHIWSLITDMSTELETDDLVRCVHLHIATVL